MDRHLRSLSRRLSPTQHRPQSKPVFGLRLAVTGGVCLTAVLALGELADVLWGPAQRDEQRIQTLLASPRPGAEDLDWARSATLQQAADHPADARPLLRLAYIDRLATGRLGPGADLLVKRSYVLEPLGPGATLWRQAFVFNNWTAASPGLRRSALSEMDAVFSHQGWEIQDMAGTIVDPAGRMMAVMASTRLRARETHRQSGSRAP